MAVIDPDVIRTIMGEADPSNPDAVRAVASVLRNRQAINNEPYGNLISEGFEARQDPQTWSKLSAVPTTDPNYQKVVQATLPILSGDEAPVGPYTYYYSPNAQAAKGRSAPSFADPTSGVNIGGNVFYTKPYGGQDPSTETPAASISSKIAAARQAGHSDSDIYQYLQSSPTYAPLIQTAKGQGYSDKDVYQQLGLTPPKEVAALPDTAVPKDALGQDFTDANWYHSFTPGAHMYYDVAGKNPVTDQQQATYQKIADAGVMDLRQPTGSKGAPYPMHSDDDPIDPKWYAIRPNGDLIAPQAVQPGEVQSAAAGAQTGLMDVRESIAQGLSKAYTAMTGGVPQWLQDDANQTKQKQTQYAASPEAFTAGGKLGHAAGQAVGSAPFLAAGGEALGATAGATESVPVLGKALQFVAGQTGAPLAEGAGVIPKVGNALLRTASQSTAGAQLGAGGAALTGQNPVTGAEVGAILPVAGEAGREVGGAINGLVTPLTDSGQQALAQNAVSAFADGGPTVVNTNQLIPGVQPTLAQATGNPGVAALERSVRNTPQGANAFAARDQANAAARLAATESVTGTPATLDAAIADRSATALPKLENALTGATSSAPVTTAAQTPTLDATRKMLGVQDASDEAINWASKLLPPTGDAGDSPVITGLADPRPVISTIDDILAGPTGQRDAVANSLRSVRSKLVSTDPQTGIPIYQTDPAQLYGVRQHATDLISPLAKGDGGGPLAAKQLTQITGALDQAIEAGAPGYGDYMQTYADMSKPVDQQRFLQGLNLQNPQGDITLPKVNSAINSAETLRSAKGANDAKSLTDDQMNYLYSLREDLRRESNSSLGMGRIGSSTVQNLASTQMMNKLGVAAPALKFIQGIPAVGPTLHNMLGAGYDAANGKVVDHLTNMLLNPSESGQHLNLTPEQNSLLRGVLKNKVAQSFGAYGAYPAATNATSNTLSPPQ